MKNIVHLVLTAIFYLVIGCGNSFNEAQDYFTGPVSGVGLKPVTSIVSGDSEQLSAVVIPVKTANKGVTWTSSDNSIASVDGNGLVTGVAVIPHGTTKQAVITVTTVEGNYSAQCTVTVVEKPVPVTGVTLNKGASYLLTGNSEILIASVYPSDATNQNITWTSSNSLIASVDGSGIVSTGTNMGTVVITVTTGDGGYTASCQFTVTATPVPVTGVTLNKSFTVTAIGNSETLFATIAPLNATNQNLIWSSDNTGVATVNVQGTVTGTGERSAIITVRTVDGNYSAQCGITVTALPVAVTGVDLMQSSMTVLAGGQGELTASILPGSATNQNLVWTSSNNLVASVDSSGVVTGVSPGSAVITVTTQDGGYSKTCSVTVASAVTYPVTYDGNGSASGSAPLTLSYLPGSTVVVMNNSTLARPGYTFAGWNTNPGGTGSSYAAGDTFPMGAGPVTLYALWSAVFTYTVTYDGNGATSGTAPSAASYLPGATVTVAGSGTLSWEAHAFSGWSTNQDGTGVLHPAGSTFIMGPNPVALYAMWTAVPVYTYTVVYVGSGSVSGTPPVDGNNYVTGASVTVLGSGELRGAAITDGITQRLSGWNTKFNGSGSTYLPGSTLVMDATDVILYARWTSDIDVIGKRGPAGGYIFYAKTTGYDDTPLGDGILWRYLEAAPEDQSSGIHWSNVYDNAFTSTGIGYGSRNTAYAFSLGCTSGAIKICNDYSRTVNGVTYDGWFLPSYDELIAMINILSDPSVGGMIKDDYAYYWSSTEYYVTDAIRYDGYSYNYASKNGGALVRAVRQF